MKTLTQYINEVVKPENGKEWEVYFNGILSQFILYSTEYLDIANNFFKLSFANLYFHD